MLRWVFVLAMLGSGPALSQTISLKDLTAKVDAQAGELGGFRALLTDPDPTRSMAAMQAMLTSGDTLLVSMALEVGAFSPNSAVRAIAMRGYFDGKPNISIKFDFSPPPEDENERNELQTQFPSMYPGASIGSDWMGSMSRSVGSFDPAQGCYVEGQSEVCLVKLSGDTVSILLETKRKSWVTLAMSEKGQYETNATIRIFNYAATAQITLVLD